MELIDEPSSYILHVLFIDSKVARSLFCFFWQPKSDFSLSLVIDQKRQELGSAWGLAISLRHPHSGGEIPLKDSKRSLFVVNRGITCQVACPIFCVLGDKHQNSYYVRESTISAHPTALYARDRVLLPRKPPPNSNLHLGRGVEKQPEPEQVLGPKGLK
jgi:hypothetical protein